MPRRLGISSGSSLPSLPRGLKKTVVDVDSPLAAAEPGHEERPVDVAPVVAGRTGEAEGSGARAEDFRRIEQHVAIGDEKEPFLVHPALLELEHRAGQGLLFAQRAARRQKVGGWQGRHPGLEMRANPGVEHPDQSFRLVPVAPGRKEGGERKPGKPETPMRRGVAGAQADLETAVDAAGGAEFRERFARPVEQAARPFQPGAERDRVGPRRRRPQPHGIARRDRPADRPTGVDPGEGRKPRQRGEGRNRADMAEHGIGAAIAAGDSLPVDRGDPAREHRVEPGRGQGMPLLAARDMGGSRAPQEGGEAKQRRRPGGRPGRSRAAYPSQRQSCPALK